MWFDLLKSKKVRQPRTQTMVYDQTPTGTGKYNLLPQWVKSNVRHEWKFNVSVQYNTLGEMFRTNTKNDRLLLCSWYLRSYIPKIDSEFKKRLSGKKMSNPFTGEGQSSAPFQIIPIKSMTGKLLSYVLLKYNKKIPEINFLMLLPNAQHPKGKGAEIMDLGNGSVEPNWENNLEIKNHIRKIYGLEEVGETPAEKPTPETTLGDAMSEEDKRKLQEGL